MIELLKSDYFSALDVQFARTVGRISGEDNPLALLAAAATNKHVSLGHICLDMRTLAGRPVETMEGTTLPNFQWPAFDQWKEAVDASPLFCDFSECDDSPTPLVVEGDRLYLFRYWRYQQRLAHCLNSLAASPVKKIASKILNDGLDRLFGAPLPVAKPKDMGHQLALFSAKSQETSPFDGQRMAAQKASINRFCVIFGGPGTGKTSTVVKLLALLLEQAQASDAAPPRIKMVAPTGKAAARLTESIRKAKAASGDAAINCSQQILDAIPHVASTIHRALGVRRDKATRFRFDADNPLPVDIVIVDEASMIDLATMTKLVEAIPPTARLIVLGDKDQLSSIEAGSVFSDICNADKNSLIGSGIAELSHSYRFANDGGIGRLAAAINNSDIRTAFACLANKDGRTTLIEPDQSDMVSLIKPLVMRHYLPCVKLSTDADAQTRMALLGSFRILCTHREGPQGVEGVNEYVEQLLRPDQSTALDDWYAGRPIMITKNDYRLSLFNGDVGVVASADSSSQKKRVFFEAADETMRAVNPARLGSYETVWAMTVHKSQGSEFDHVLVVLPPRRSMLLTRELLYTAVTRAKKTVTIIGSKKVLAGALTSVTSRNSGLHRLLI